VQKVAQAFDDDAGRARTQAAGKVFGRGQEKVVEKIPQTIDDDAGRARTQAAAITGTNERYVSDAKRIAEDAPEVLEMMRERDRENETTYFRTFRNLLREVKPARPESSSIRCAIFCTTAIRQRR